MTKRLRPHDTWQIGFVFSNHLPEILLIYFHFSFCLFTFAFPHNWLCLALFSLTSNRLSYYIILFIIDTCIHFSSLHIGFVFSNRVRIFRHMGIPYLSFSAGHLTVQRRRESILHPTRPLELALNWVCFFVVSKHENLHNHLSYRYLSSFCPLANWLCFFKLPTRKQP